MIEIHCDICNESRKFQSGPNADYTLWFTTVLLSQIAEKDKTLPCRKAIDICYICRDHLLDGGEAHTCWARFDECLISGIQETLNRKPKTEAGATDRKSRV